MREVDAPPAVRARAPGGLLMTVLALLAALLASGSMELALAWTHRTSAGFVRDRTRLRQIAEVSGTVSSYRLGGGRRGAGLPATLEAAARGDAGEIDRFVLDPLSRKPMAYRVLGSSSYELCTTFETAATYPGGDAFWNHRTGPACFTFDALANPRRGAPADARPWYQTNRWEQGC